VTYSRVVGTGSYLPEKVVLNIELASEVDTSDEWIRTRTGIMQRHLAAPEQTTSDLAFGAAQRAMAAKNEPGTPQFRVALRDAIVTTKELVGTHGVYNFKPDSRYGSDERARVVVKLEKGQWKLVQ